MREAQAFYQRSICDPDGFWGEQAQLIDWQVPYTRVLEQPDPPFRQWFVGGETHLCHNAVNRHLATRAEQPALITLSSETGDLSTLDDPKAVGR
ncbi:MAG: acetyl-coenzyme A synthetase N-terminal domain-containing protein [Pseudomonadota bacterium]|nr:acetyl-coenzyme A synthetase N-terminal domain-containing protein [Pseudomonadota bacterium]